MAKKTFALLPREKIQFIEHKLTFSCHSGNVDTALRAMPFSI